MININNTISLTDGENIWNVAVENYELYKTIQTCEVCEMFRFRVKCKKCLTGEEENFKLAKQINLKEEG